TTGALAALLATHRLASYTPGARPVLSTEMVDVSTSLAKALPLVVPMSSHGRVEPASQLSTSPVSVTASRPIWAPSLPTYWKPIRTGPPGSSGVRSKLLCAHSKVAAQSSSAVPTKMSSPPPGSPTTIQMFRSQLSFVSRHQNRLPSDQNVRTPSDRFISGVTIHSSCGTRSSLNRTSALTAPSKGSKSPSCQVKLGLVTTLPQSAGGTPASKPSDTRLAPSGTTRAGPRGALAGALLAVGSMG